MRRVSHYLPHLFFLLACLVFGWSADPNTPKWLAMGLLALALLPQAREIPRLTVAIGLLWLWAVLSLSWSPDQLAGLHSLWQVSLVVIVFALGGRLPLAALATMATAGVLVLAVAAPHSIGGMGNANWQAEFLLLSLPFVMLMAWGDRPRHIFLALLALACIAFPLLFGYEVEQNKVVGLKWGAEHSNAAWLVMGADLAAISVFLLWRRQYAFGLIGILSFFMGVALFWERFALSLGTRLEFALNTFRLWLDAPLFGHGLGGFNYEYPRVQEWHLSVFPDMGTSFHDVTMVAGAAHNEWLELASTLGLVGLILAGFVVFCIVMQARRTKWTPEKWAALACLYHALILSFIAFPLQNPATALLIVCSLAVVCRGVPVFEIGWKLKLTPLPALCVILTAAGFFWMGDYHNRVVPNKAVDPIQRYVANMRATEAYPLYWRYRHDLILTLRVLFNSSTPERRIVLSDAAADKIYARALSSSRFAPDIMIARAEYLANAKRNPEEARHLVELIKEVAGHREETRQIANIVEGAF